MGMGFEIIGGVTPHIPTPYNPHPSFSFLTVPTLIYINLDTGMMIMEHANLLLPIGNISQLVLKLSKKRKYINDHNKCYILAPI